MHPQPKFGRIHAPDPRDGHYPMRLLLDRLAIEFPQVVAPGYRHYRHGPVLDQGETGTCVGHAWRAFLSSAPLMTKTGPNAFDIYDGAIAIDEWADNDVDPNRELGTSVRAGCEVLRAKGHVGNYLWASSADEIRRWLLAGLGPVVMGTLWFESMMRPHEGFLRITTRNVAGGHAYILTGWSDDITPEDWPVKHQGSARMQNSWSTEWGNRGRAWIDYDTLDALVKADGEACAAVEQKLGGKSGPTV